MKKIFKSLFLIPSIVLIFSCTDESLDPLKFKEIKKGTILALRGQQLDNIYFEGIPGSVLYANNIKGTETFDFDAEFLSADLTSLSSFDVFALKKTKSGSAISIERKLLVNVPFSQFKTTADYRGPWVSVSIPVSTILTAIGSPTEAQLFDVYENGIDIQSDLNLADGTKVLADDIVDVGLFQSDQFYPAQILGITIADVDEIRPVATTSQRGQVVVSGGKITRPIRPLKAGTKDTVDIKFDQPIAVAPTVTMSATPSLSGTLGAVTAVTGSTSNFYVIFTTDPAAVYTGNVSINVTGAKTADGLAQIGKTHTLAMDNLLPQLISFSTGTRIGIGGTATFTAVFNERLTTAPKISTVAGGIDPKVDLLTNVSMTLSADGLTATYPYEYKDTGNDGVHGSLTVNLLGGADAATNSYGSTSGSLTVDLGTPPAPTLALNATQHDWGTQIKWSGLEATSAANPGGAIGGTVYFVAITSGKPGPTAFGFASDGSPSWTMAVDPASSTGAKVANRQTGSLTTSATSGSSGTVYTAFTANGTLDIYTVFVGSTGNTSAVPAVPQLTAVVMN